MRRTNLGAALFVLAAAILGSTSALAQPPGSTAAATDPAEVKFRQANELARARKWAEAIVVYREALALRKAWDIAGNLGLAELEADVPRDAAEHLHYATAQIGASAKPEQKELLRKAYDKAKSRVVTLNVKASRDGATISVDGKVVGVTPLPAPVFVTPGPHRIEATLGTDASAERGDAAVDAPAGATETLTIAMKGSASDAATAPPAQPPPSPARPPPEEPADGKPWWPAALLGGGAAIGVGVGVGLLVASSSARSDADALVADVPAGTCSGTETSGVCFEASEKTGSANGLAAGSAVAFVAGGLLAGGCLTYLLWPSGGSDTARSGEQRLTPYASDQGAGIVVHGSF